MTPNSSVRPSILRFYSRSLSPVIILFLFLLLQFQPSNQSLFSILRNTNLNRYLKNPLFTKSVAPGWPNEAFEHGGGGGGSSSGLVPSPQSSQIAEFIKSQNKFTNEHLMETYGTNFNFDSLLPPPETFPGVIAGGGGQSLPTPAALSAQPPPNSKTPPSSPKQARSIFNATKHFFDDKVGGGGGRANSKSLTVSSSNINAYSDSSKLASFIGGNKNANLYSTKANSSSNANHLFVDTPSSAVRASPTFETSATSSSNRYHQTNTDHHHNADNFESSLLRAGSNNKYNQEKALNLKLEYGFRPLPPSGQPKSTHNSHSDADDSDSEGFRTKDFTVTNSIQMNSDGPFVDFAKEDSLSAVTEDLQRLKQISSSSSSTSSKGGDEDLEEGPDSLGGGGGNNIYSSLGKISTPSVNKNTGDDDEEEEEESERMRSMKSLAFEALNSHNHQQQHLDPTDLKRYISYPMETESSDIHKLAFTGVESFHKAEHANSYADHHDLGGLGGLGSVSSISGVGSDSLAGYPQHLKSFKTQGIDCARNAGYCEYDSSYPKEHVNSIVGNCSQLLTAMYIDLPEEGLVDFTGYKSFIEVHSSARSAASLRAGGAFNGSLCEAERKYIRPSVGQDVEGHFYLILQSSYYFQQVPVEICSNPGHSCNVVGRCNSAVKCVQKYRTHMLISIDTDDSNGSAEGDHHHRASHSSHSYHHHNHHHQHSHHSHHHHSNEKSGSSSAKVSAPRCPRMRMYRLPSSCVCELSRV